MRNVVVAYLLWLPGVVLVCGLHRLYCGRVFTGLLWLFTFGVLGLGQLMDLLLIPGMVAGANHDWLYSDGSVRRQSASASVTIYNGPYNDVRL